MAQNLKGYRIRSKRTNLKHLLNNTETKYNGWINRATWLINVWYEPNTTSDLDWIKEELEERASTLANSENVCDKILSDMLDLQAIDWDELKEHVETEETCEAEHTTNN